LVSAEIIDTHFIKVINAIMDFDENQGDAHFVEHMKDIFANFIGEWIEELQDGFVNGMSDVVVFFRENFKIMIEAGAGPEMGMMMGGIGTDSIMKYVTVGYKRYQENKEKLKAQRAQ
jgi:hypothetical protein